MHISEELTDYIKARLKEFIASDNSEPAFLHKFAAQFNVLPLYVDWTHCTGGCPDGEVLTFSHDDADANLHIEEDDLRRKIALFLGSKKYPALSVLLPERPSDASECPRCKGTGVVPGLIEMGLDPEALLCCCGGLGWVPKDFKANLDK